MNGHAAKLLRANIDEQTDTLVVGELLYALPKQLADHVLLMEEYQFKGVPIQDGGVAAKLSERVEVDCLWVDKLIVRNPHLNDDQFPPMQKPPISHKVKIKNCDFPILFP